MVAKKNSIAKGSTDKFEAVKALAKKAIKEAVKLEIDHKRNWEKKVTRSGNVLP